MAQTDIENTQDSNAIGVVCSALVRPSFVFGSDDDGGPDFRSLVGPGGWECYLGEPEDALWCRDGEDAMNMLNELAARVKILSDFARTAPGRLPSNVQSALWPNDVWSHKNLVYQSRLEKSGQLGIAWRFFHDESGES